MAKWTTDGFFNGRLQVLQEKEGYRFSLDAVIVAEGVHPKPGDLVLDLGTGCGIIALLLAFRYASIRLAAIEIQPRLAALAQANVRQNELDHRITIVPGDMRRLHPDAVGGPADWIVCNPPFRKPHSGRLNPQAQKARARHEINVNLQEVVQSARRFLRNGGRFVAIYPAERSVDLLTTMRQEDIEPKWLQSIHSSQADVAKLVCVSGKKGGRPGLTVKKPLVVYGDDKAYTPDMDRMLRP